jgi:hypothetical protein
MNSNVIDLLKSATSYASDSKMKELLQNLKDKLPLEPKIADKETLTLENTIHIRSFKEKFLEWWQANAQGLG